MSEQYFTKVSEQIDLRVTELLSQKISRTESSFIGVSSKLDELLPNPRVRTCSGTVPRTSRCNESENRKHTGDRSLSNPFPEAIFITNHSGNLNGSELEETSHMVTAVQERFPYCSPGTSSEKQKRARSTSQPQLLSENTPATIEADQMMSALPQLTTYSDSANFNNTINRISKLPKSLKTTMPTFDGKSERIELFEDLCQTSLQIHNQLMEEDKIDYHHFLMRGDALQTFQNITSLNREKLGEILNVFRRIYMNTQSMTTARHKCQRLVFNLVNRKLTDFLDELRNLAKDAFGFAAQVTIEQFIYAIKHPHLMKSIDQALLENGT